jgi:hypothetical protein
MVQAADVLVRRELGLRGVDDLAVERVDGEAVTLRTRDGARLRAAIDRRLDDRPRLLSCRDEKPETVPAHTLADLTVLDRAA